MKHDDQQRLARLRAIVEAYGANPELWPAEERNAVGDLVSSSEARAWLEAESRVDAWLADEPELAPSADLLRRVAEIPLRHEARPASARPASWIWPFGRLRNAIAVATAAAAVGLAVGMVTDVSSDDGGDVYDDLSSLALGVDVAEAP